MNQPAGKSLRSQRIVVSEYGGAEVLRLIEEDIPQPNAGEVRVKILAAGVAMPDVMAREGIHPETPRVPYTPGWDLVGVVDSVGKGAADFNMGQLVAAMPIFGSYASYLCLRQEKIVPVPSGLDPAEAVSLILNYITAYQMLHHLAHTRSGQSILIHGASGGVGTGLLQLGRLVGATTFGTCSTKGTSTVRDLGGIPIDYTRDDLEEEILKLSGGGVDAVFDPFNGKHLWQSRHIVHNGGRVIGYGTTTSLREEGLGAKRRGKRNPFHGTMSFALYILGGLIFPGRRRILPYSIQWLMRLRRSQFRQDLITLFDLLKNQKIHPIVAHRFPLSEAKQAHELLSKGGVIGKIVLLPDMS